ncbi:MAG: hypothetical protein RLZZ385_1433, partial [Pseudomonadota bacterium]
MKTLLVSLSALPSLLLVVLVLAALAGFPPAYIWSAPGVATGIGAKLLCSSRYVSGFGEQQSFEDLVQYSPILSNLSIAYDDQARTVTTTLLGLSPTTASFQEGVGCALDFAGFDRPPISTSSDLPDAQALWPAGNLTGSPAPSLQTALEDMLAADNDAGLNTRALLVVKQGAIIAEAYGQGATADTPLLGWSMAKSLTSVMLGNLEYRGLLDIGEPPGFEAWQDDDRRDITVRDLLTMTDGLGFAEAYDPGDDATAMLFTEPSAANYVLQQPLEHRPGTVFNYSSGTANLLAYLHYLRTGADPASA